MSEYKLRFLEEGDYEKGYIELLNQLTSCPKIEKNKFKDILQKIYSQSINVYVIEENNKIIATATIIYEQKFIHDCGVVAHLEDVVIDEEFRGCGLGKKMIESIIEVVESKGCYKIICNCRENLEKFYGRCGFERKNIQMAIYF